MTPDDDDSAAATGRIRDDLLKPYVARMDASKLLRPAPLLRRAKSALLFVCLFVFLSGVARNYALVAAAAGLGAVGANDAFSLKSLRTLVRVAALERGDPLAADAGFAGFVWCLVVELIEPSAALVLVTLLCELLLLLLLALFAEQLAKSLVGIVVVRHFSHANLHPLHNEEPSADWLNTPTPPRIVPAWRRQLALLARAPFAVIDWIRLALGAPYRWADLRVDGYFDVCVPLDEWAHPFMRRALRRLYNDAHSGRFMPKSGRVRSIIAGVVVACLLAGAPSSLDALTAFTSGGARLAVPITLGADIAPGDRVRALSALLDTSEFVRDNLPLVDERTRLRAVRRADHSALPRHYVTVRGQAVQLDVDRQLWDRTGLWYGAELMTPFGSACVVGIDAANQLWVAHDVHVLTRTPVPLLSYGAFESVGALVHYGVHVLEDPALLGAAAAGATATAKAAAAATWAAATQRRDPVDVQLDGDALDQTTAAGQVVREMLDRMRDGEDFDQVLADFGVQVITLDANNNEVVQAVAEEEAAAAEADDEEEEAPPRGSRVQIEIE